MSMTDERMRRILDAVAYTAAHGKIAARVARGLREAYENNRITCSRWFFGAASGATEDRMLLYCYRLLVSTGAQSESVTVDYLLNYAQSNPGVFRFANPGDVQKSVDADRKALEKMSPLIDKVARERNRSIAHMDRKWINSPEAMLLPAPVIMSEVERSFGTVLALVNVYKGYFDNTEVHWQHLDGEVHADLEWLWSIIGRSNMPIPE